MSDPHRRIPLPSRLLGVALGAALLGSLIPMAEAAATATDTLIVATSLVGSTTQAGVAFTVTVTAQNGGITDTGYTATVHFTSTDAQAALPADYTFTGADNGQHSFSVTLKTSGSQTVTASDNVSSAPGSAAVSVTPGAVASLTFSRSPSNSRVGVVFATQPQVIARDAYSNAVTTDPVITLSHTPGTPAAGGTADPSGCTYSWNNAGVATFSSCLINAAGHGYRLRATAGSVTADSATFDVWGNGTMLLFTQQPGATNNATLPFPTQPQVTMLDQYGSNVGDFAGYVTLGILNGTGTVGASLSCSSQLATAGVATFSGCSINLAGTGYRLTATTTSPTLAGFYSNTFNVLGAPTKLAIYWGNTTSVTPPSGSTGGAAFPIQPWVVEQDSAGNTITTDSSTVIAVSITGTTSGATLTCTGGTSLKLAQGIAQFNGCAIDKVGTYQITAAANPYRTSATSNAFNVAVGTPTKLVWAAQPNSGVAAQPFATQPVVSITDAGGNVVTTAGATITLSILNNPAGGTLTCTGGLSKATYLGAATFSGCAINNAGVGYALAATAANVSPVVSLASIATNPFTVVAPQATITLSTSATAIIWAKPVTLTVQFGLNGANKPFVLQRSINNLDWAAVPDINVPTSTNASGTATFTSTPDRNYYYRVMFAGTADLSAAYSNTVRVVVRQIALLRPIRSGSFYVRTGSSMTFTTTVRPARADLPVKARVTFTFKLYRAGHLVYSGRRDVYIDAYGKASWTWRFGSPGTWQVRAVANPTPVNANSYWSQIDTVIAY